MPTAKPRITVTLEPHAYEVLSRLSAASDQSMASIVSEIFGTALPSLERVVVILERAASASKEVRDGVAASVERAERDLMPMLLEALGQGDMFLADLEQKTVGEGEANAGLPASVPTSRQRGVFNPRPVTRG